MTKTSSDIEGDIYNMLRGSDLAKQLSGSVYRKGYRPRDSKLEDAVVIFTAGLNGEVQEGTVTINVYVPDIDAFDNGVLVKNGERVATLERLCQQWRDSLNASTSNYLFIKDDEDTVHTVPEEDIHQHFIVVTLNYRYYDNVN